MLTVPPAILDLLRLGAGAAVEIGVKNGRLIVQPKYALSTPSINCWRSATRSIPLQLRIAPGSMPNRSAKNSCSDVGSRNIRA